MLLEKCSGCHVLIPDLLVSDKIPFSQLSPSVPISHSVAFRTGSLKIVRIGGLQSYVGPSLTSA